MGVTPHVYVRMRRLEAARSAMTRGTPPRIALRDIGYVNASHARSAFTAHFGYAP
jgi:methylphosphotriester-DNA--protein-cysteine methyltransferase